MTCTVRPRVCTSVSSRSCSVFLDLCRMPLGLQHFRLQAVRLVAACVMQVLPAGLGVGVDDHEKQDDGPEPAEHHVQEREAECVKRPAFHVRKPG